MGSVTPLHPHDPEWVKFSGRVANFIRRQGGGAWRECSKHENPTIGVGAYNCRDCEKPHVTFALVLDDGTEINVNVEPDVATEIAKAIVDALARVGHDLLALKALRALSLVSELASMTDTEADFLDGSGIREACRLMLKGKAATVPRLYDGCDRERAAAVIYDLVVKGKLVTPASARTGMSGFYGPAVDSIAEALGMRFAGG